VAAADAKLGRIHALLEEAAHPRDLVTVVTSDHGEHLGEHGLLGHEFSLRSVLLNVPLVVHGVPESAPGLVEDSVWLGDVTPSVLDWVGIDVPTDLAGRPLPLVGGHRAPERDLVAAYTDSVFLRPPGRSAPADYRHDPRRRRGDCREEHRVFGDILALTRFPFKLIWYARHPPQLYDLSWDPRELSDIAPHQTELVTRLASELARLREGSRLLPPSEPPEVAPEAAEALRALGYAR
jgi:arylsulfatase A-like enzyme